MRFHIKIKRLYLIIISFLILSIFSVLFIWYNNIFYFNGDSYFHIERLIELIRSKYLFPQYALNSFDFVGSSVMTMYPYILLYPIAGIYFIIRSLKATLFIAFIGYTLLTFIICYFSSYKLSNNSLVSYLFSLIYSLSGEFTAMYFNYPDIGVYFSAIFLPLVIFGFIYYLQDNRWLMLSIGMSLILYSNIISFIFISIILCIWLALNYKLITKKKLLNLIHLISLTLLSTAFEWIPLVRLIIFNNLSIPKNNIVAPVNIFTLIKDALSNTSANDQFLTIYSLIGVVIGAFLFKVYPRVIKQLYLLSIFIILFSSRLFPWYISSNNFVLFKLLRFIQFTIRMMVIPQLILEFILAYSLVYVIGHKSKILRHALLVCLIGCILLIQLSSQSIYTNSHNNVVHPHMSQPVLYNKSHIMKNPLVYTNNTDYWPGKAIDSRYHLFKDQGINNGKIIQFSPKGHGVFYFHARKNLKNRLIIPFIYYNKTSYTCTLDGKQIKVVPTNNQLMATNSNICKGYHKLHIIINMNIFTKISLILSIIGLIGYLYYYLIFFALY